jgi:hypothetical protein
MTEARRLGRLEPLIFHQENFPRRGLFCVNSLGIWKCSMKNSGKAGRPVIPTIHPDSHAVIAQVVCRAALVCICRTNEHVDPKGLVHRRDSCASRGRGRAPPDAHTLRRGGLAH